MNGWVKSRECVRFLAQSKGGGSKNAVFGGLTVLGGHINDKTPLKEAFYEVPVALSGAVVARGEPEAPEPFALLADQGPGVQVDALG